MKWTASGMVVACIFASGCADPSRNLYEGIRIHNESMKTPEERAASPRSPSYDEYKKERDKLKHGDNEKGTER